MESPDAISNIMGDLMPYKEEAQPESPTAGTETNFKRYNFQFKRVGRQAQFLEA